MIMNAKENMEPTRRGTDVAEEVLYSLRSSLQRFMLKENTGVGEIQKLERAVKEEIFDRTK